ncbi:MAG: AAA family ATPase [Caldilineaceae bacterium]|nr:AAA family ATPase [Caldilineaceae bacterium]
MYHSITIRNFRCFEHLVADEFTTINLITGYNNAGKSALLEALWLHSVPNNPRLSLRLHRFRGIPSLDQDQLLHDLHFNYDIGKPIELTAHGSWGDNPRRLTISHKHVPATWIPFPQPNGSTRTGIPEVKSNALINSEFVWLYTDEEGESHKSFLRWNDSLPPQGEDGADPGIVVQAAELPPQPVNVFLSARFREHANVDCNEFSDLIKRGEDHLVVDFIQRIDSRIKKIVILSRPSLMLYVDTGLKQYIPVGLLGDGVNRLLSMALAVFSARNGILLLDEIENGLHYLKLPAMWQNLSTLAKHFNVQVFATTHSEECIRAAHTALASVSSEALSVHRIDQYEKGQLATTYNNEALDYAVEFGSEMR